ncbi:MAG: DUF4097 family beta strand repeat-containing protein [Bryobacteraceae bacterium]
MRRRGSLVGPLLVILIGVWFLISSLRPDLPLFDLAARFWPFVLIGWGVLRFAEILLWAAQGRTLPRAGVSHGEWTLVVFICLMGSFLYVVNRHRPWQQWGFITGSRVEIFGHPYDFTIPEQTAPAPKAARILIENLRGGVRIVGADAQEVKVSGRKTIRSLQESDANNAHKQTSVDISTQGDQVVVRTNQDRVTGDERISTDLEMTVPRTASVEIRGRSGDLDISDLNGSVEVSSDNASVRLQNIASSVRLDLRKSELVRAGSVKGDFVLQSGRGRDVELDTIGGEVTIDGSYSGDLQFRDCAKQLKFQSPQTDLKVEKLPGQIHLDLGSLSGSNLVGPIRLRSNRSRDVQLEQFTQALELSLDRGDITLRPAQMPLAKIDARTRSGQIDLALPESAKFELKATTSRGDLNNEYGAALRTDYENGRRHEAGGSILGSVGQGPSITVTTDRGTVTVRKDTGGPPPPPRPPKPPKAPGVTSIEIERH